MWTHPPLLAGPTLYRVADLARFLTGRWRIERDLDDVARTVRGHFLGEANITDDGAGVLDYHEEGELVFGAHRGHAWRTYRYRLTGPTSAAVTFGDGRRFYDLELSSGHAEVVHRCGGDVYRGTIRALCEDTFSTHWHVTGPGRDVVLSSRLTRVPVLQGNVGTAPPRR